MNTFPRELVRSACYRSKMVRPVRWLAVSLLCLLATQTARASEHAHITPEQAYQLALEARTERDYPAMLSFLRRAADADDLAAQELLGSVLLAGPALYGPAIRADHCEAAYWIRRATAGGSHVALHQRIVLNGLRDFPQGRDSCADKAG